MARMRAEGYEVRRRGKSLEFKAQGQERYRRSYRLGEDYSEEALQGRIAGTWKAQRDDGPKKSTGNCEKAAKKKQTDHGRRVNLLVDIQAKIQAGKGKGYEHTANFVRWAKVFNLKEAAKTLNFLTGNGVEDYGELVARAEAAGKKFDELSARIKRLEGRMAEIARLKTISSIIQRHGRFTKNTRGRVIRRHTGRNTRRRLKSTKRRRLPLTFWEEKRFRRWHSLTRNMQSCWRRKRRVMRNTKRPGRI